MNQINCYPLLCWSNSSPVLLRVTISSVVGSVDRELVSCCTSTDACSSLFNRSVVLQRNIQLTRDIYLKVCLKGIYSEHIREKY